MKNWITKEYTIDNHIRAGMALAYLAKVLDKEHFHFRLLSPHDDPTAYTMPIEIGAVNDPAVWRQIENALCAYV